MNDEQQATERIAEEFNRFVAVGHDRIATFTYAEKITWYVVATRCAIDIGGFSTVYEQSLDPTECRILIQGLQEIGEQELAAEFEYGLNILTTAGFYKNRDWNELAPELAAEIDTIGERVGDRLWDLDQKLVTLLQYKM